MRGCRVTVRGDPPGGGSPLGCRRPGPTRRRAGEPSGGQAQCVRVEVEGRPRRRAARGWLPVDDQGLGWWRVAASEVSSVGNARPVPRGLPEGASPLPERLGRLALGAPGCGSVTVLAFVPAAWWTRASTSAARRPAGTPPGSLIRVHSDNKVAYPCPTIYDIEAVQISMTRPISSGGNTRWSARSAHGAGEYTLLLLVFTTTASRRTVTIASEPHFY